MRRTQVRYLARQPIFNQRRQPVAYELLFRSGREDSAIISPGENASQQTLDSSVMIGLDVICGDRAAYLNCTRELLLGEDIRLLPSERVVLEILEYVEPEREVLEACRELKQAGFRIALDDFIPGESNRRFLPYADILKVDVRSTTAKQRRAIVNEFFGKFSLLAEKLETEDEFSQVQAAGFDVFQGYYLGKPELFSTASVSPEHLRQMRVATKASMHLNSAAQTA
ncbi:MAG: EAL domain-containing protein [Acidobacteriaceae bacterium]